MPQLTTFDPDLSVLSTSLATSVSSDGTTATFNFPKDASGNTLPVGHYATLVSNQTSSGVFSSLTLSTLSIGSNTSQTTPYGVDAADWESWGQSCYYDDIYGTVCNSFDDKGSTSLLTLSSTGQFVGLNGSIAVGTKPTAVKGYGNTEGACTDTDPYGGYTCNDEPSNAIVTNFGSNTVSILDIVNDLLISTISVGTEPLAVVLNNSNPASATKAYVANYGSSSVSEIDLSTNAESRVASVGAQPEALSLDPGGTALWVGGLNYISKIDLSSLSTIQSFSVSGQVTSVAVSSALNEIVYTTVSTSSGSTTFQAQQAAISSGAVQGTYAQYTMSSSAYYAEAITSGGPAPGAPGWLMSSGALVSVPYGNRYAVVGTPTGFAVIDLVSKSQVLQGTTSGPVRGIATDPNNGMIFLTQPDSIC